MLFCSLPYHYHIVTRLVGLCHMEIDAMLVLYGMDSEQEEENICVIQNIGINY